METCCFCLDEFDPVDGVCLTACKHKFHDGCFSKYVRSGDITDPFKCPICRQTWWCRTTSNITLAVFRRDAMSIVASYDFSAAISMALSGSFAELAEVVHDRITFGEDDVQHTIAAVIKLDSVFGLKTILQTSGPNVFTQTAVENDPYAEFTFVDDCTALDFAAVYDSPNALNWLLTNVPYDPFAINQALHLALINGTCSSVRRLFSTGKIDLHFVDENDTGVLLCAIKSGDNYCVDLFLRLSNVTSLSEFCEKYGTPNRRFACETVWAINNRRLFYRVISSFPFDVNATLLKVITQWDDAEVISHLLVHHQADPNEGDPSAFELCMSRQNFVPTAELLKRHGARVRSTTMSTFIPTNDKVRFVVDMLRRQDDCAELLNSHFVLDLITRRTVSDAVIKELIEEPTVIFDEDTSQFLLEKCIDDRDLLAPHVFYHPKIQRVFPFDQWEHERPLRKLTLADESTLRWLADLARRGKHPVAWPEAIVPDFAMMTSYMPITGSMIFDLLHSGKRQKWSEVFALCPDHILTWTDTLGRNFLHHLLKRDEVDIVRDLLDRDVGRMLAMMADDDGQIPIFYTRSCEMLRLFFRFDKMYMMPMSDGTSLLGRFLQQQPELVHMLLSEYIDPEHLENELNHSQGPIWVQFELLTCKHFKVTHFIENCGVFNPNVVRDGTSLLTACVSCENCVEVVRCLLRMENIDVDMFDHEDAFDMYVTDNNVDEFRICVRMICNAGYRLDTTHFSLWELTTG